MNSACSTTRCSQPRRGGRSSRQGRVLDLIEAVYPFLLEQGPDLLGIPEDVIIAVGGGYPVESLVAGPVPGLEPFP